MFHICSSRYNVSHLFLSTTTRFSKLVFQRTRFSYLFLKVQGFHICFSSYKVFILVPEATHISSSTYKVFIFVSQAKRFSSLFLKLQVFHLVSWASRFSSLILKLQEFRPCSSSYKVFILVPEATSFHPFFWSFKVLKLQGFPPCFWIYNDFFSRYVAEVSASAMSVEQLAREGRLDLQQSRDQATTENEQWTRYTTTLCSMYIKPDRRRSEMLLRSTFCPILCLLWNLVAMNCMCLNL